ncbi:MAG: hypothetical protein WCI20_13785, partial [bacterium]
MVFALNPRSRCRRDPFDGFDKLTAGRPLRKTLLRQCSFDNAQDRSGQVRTGQERSGQAAATTEEGARSTCSNRRPRRYSPKMDPGWCRLWTVPPGTAATTEEERKSYKLRCDPQLPKPFYGDTKVMTPGRFVNS